QPGEVIAAFLGLEEGPGEDADADEVDTCLAHQRHVLFPDVAWPLLGVVVTAVGDGTGGGPGKVPLFDLEGVFIVGGRVEVVRHLAPSRCWDGIGMPAR